MSHREIKVTLDNKVETFYFPLEYRPEAIIIALKIFNPLYRGASGFSYSFYDDYPYEEAVIEGEVKDNLPVLTAEQQYVVVTDIEDKNKRFISIGPKSMDYLAFYDLVKNIVERSHIGTINPINKLRFGHFDNEANFIIDITYGVTGGEKSANMEDKELFLKTYRQNQNGVTNDF